MLVIGAGFGGLGMGIQLKRCGRDDFLIVEQDAGVGGTWWANRYPGAACDIPSLLYSFSFAPKHDWTRHYPERAEIAAYLADCVERFALAPHLRLRTRVAALDWDEEAQRWIAQLQGGGDKPQRITARVVVSATGGLSRPALPAIAGLDHFAGPVCHTARWDDRIGGESPAETPPQRVGVVGTGASAIQLVPQLVARGVEVTLFLRTPPWILPRLDRAIGPAERARRARWPLWQRAQRLGVWLLYEARAPGFTRWPALLRRVESFALARMHRRIPLGPLRDALTPNYRLGCKRVLVADDFYPALLQPNARLVTKPIARVEPDGMRMADGTLHVLDALVLATGFEAAETQAPRGVRGRGGLALDDAWRANGPQALLGSTVPGFPNLFLVAGPNTGLGHNSMVLMIESQIGYVLDALAQLDRRGLRVFEPRRSAFDAFNAELQARLPRTVWATGCRAWYQTASGRITTLWPGSTLEFRRRTRSFDAQQYELS